MILSSSEAAVYILSHVERSVRTEGLPRRQDEFAVLRAVDTLAAFQIRVFLGRKYELMLKWKRVKCLQVLFGGPILVVQFEDQPVVIDTSHAALPLAAGSLLVMVVQHVKLHVSNAPD